MKHIPRIFVNCSLYNNAVYVLTHDQANHLIRVLRMRDNEVVHLFNEHDGEWCAKLHISPTPQAICAKQLKSPIIENGPCLACCLINPTRFNLILEKATELGVQEIVPIISDYTQTKNINYKKAQQILIHASEQSGRLSVPILHPIQDLKKFCLNKDILVGTEDHVGSELYNIIQRDSTFLVGPEGGFSPSEYALFEQSSYIKKINLGRNILRSETAAIAFTAVWASKFL